MPYKLSYIDPGSGLPRLLSRQCATCLFLPGNPMRLRPGRLHAMAQRGLGGRGIVCHDTLPYGAFPDTGAALCRGFYDAYRERCDYIVISERIGGFTEVPPPGEKERSDG